MNFLMLATLTMTTLWQGFVRPPEASKPWCYWWWLNGNVDRRVITEDLESIRRLGFGGVLMFDSRGYWDGGDDYVSMPPVKLVWGSPEWQDHVEFAIRECARLGLVFTMNVSASGGTLNGYRDGAAYEVDVTDAAEVERHLETAVGSVLARVPDMVGKTFTHVYSVSYEGKARKHADWQQVRDALYMTMRTWAHARGLQVYSESGGPWEGAARQALKDADQRQMLAFNDIPQGEFWPVDGAQTKDAGHANANGRFFLRGPVLSAQDAGGVLVSAEAFTHMRRHWSVDPAFLKPLGDQAFADGANRLVWHTFTCSPPAFGVPGSEYFAGSHINRNVTWHEDAAAFVRYLGRCQFLLQRGVRVEDPGTFVPRAGNYHGWGRFRVQGASPFTWCHRRDGSADLFFVVGEGKGEVELAAVAREVEIWDPVRVARHVAKARRIDDRHTRVELDLPVGGSCFVMFADTFGEKASPAELRRERETVPGPWQVSFAYPQGVAAEPPKARTMEKLVDWTDVEDLRHFSGTGVYRTTFRGKAASLSLGVIPSGLAHVSVNGRDCGTVWCAPWEADISDAAHDGLNDLEIRVVNNWCNRLIGDCLLPADKRVTHSNLHYWDKPRTGNPRNPWKQKPTIWSGYSSFDPLQKSGLKGPVSLIRFASSK